VSDDLEFSYVTEVRRGGYSYPGTALLGVRGIPTAFLAQSSLRVTCVARRAALFDPRTDDLGGARDLGSPRNPALAVRDLVTSSEGVASERFGGGAWFGPLDLFVGLAGDLDGLVAWADFCDAWVHRPGDDPTRPAGPENGERRCRLDVVLDTPQALMETVGDMAWLGYCFATLQGAKWRFPLDQDGDPVFTFVDEADPENQNASGIVLTLEGWERTPTAVSGSFWSAVLDYERDDLTHPVDVPEATPTNVSQVDLRGVTRETEAARMLRHLAVQARALPMPVQWTAHPGVQHVEAGDLVLLRTRVPWSVGATATDLKVRVLAVVVGTGEDGKLSVTYAGRVMESASYALHPVTVPVTTRAAQRAAALAERRQSRRLVTGLRARVV
jgi:hypothetical protein